MNKLFTYWENMGNQETPPLIKYCLDTFRRRGDNIELIILNPKNIEDYIRDTGLHPNWRKLEVISQKVDALRIAVLYKYGGIWCDADTILLKPLNHLYNENNINLFRWTFNSSILNGYFIAKEKSIFLSKALETLNVILDKEFMKNYTIGGGVYLGEGIFNKVAWQCSYNELPRETFIPIEFPVNPRCFILNDTIEHYLTPDTVAVAMTWSQFDDDFKRKSIEEHIKAINLLGSILRYSEGIK